MMPIKNWSAAMNHLGILFKGQVLIGEISSNSLKQTPVGLALASVFGVGAGFRNAAVQW